MFDDGQVRHYQFQTGEITVRYFIRHINDAGTTIVMVTHSETCAEYAHRVVAMQDGRCLPEHGRAGSGADGAYLRRAS